MNKYGQTDEAREEWNMWLATPLPGTEKRKPTASQLADEAASFDAVMNMIGA